MKYQMLNHVTGQGSTQIAWWHSNPWYSVYNSDLINAAQLDFCTVQAILILVYIRGLNKNPSSLNFIIPIIRTDLNERHSS